MVFILKLGSLITSYVSVIFQISTYDSIAANCKFLQSR